MVYTKLHAAGSSAAGPTSPRAASTEWAPPSSTPSPHDSTSTSTGPWPARGCPSSAACPACSPARVPRRRSPRSPGLTRKGGRVAKNRTGTHVRFWPDRQIFTKDATFVFEDLLSRARHTSFIVPGLELVIRDLRGDTPVEEKFRHDGGIGEYAEFLAKDEPVTDVLRLAGSDTFVETVPLLDDKGHMTRRRSSASSRSTSPCAGAPATTPRSGPT